ncbi:MAG: TonB family protein [Opitutaceae bacterium]|nr:TonB family protein [Opitutaceae bacterium]
MHLFAQLRRGVLPLLVLGALGAQDVTITKPVWQVPHDAPDELPVLKGSPQITFPPELRATAEIGYVAFDLIVDGKGKVLMLNPHATQPALEHAAHLGKSGGYAWSPGRRDKKGVNTATTFAVIFNPVSAREKGEEATPRLLEVAVVRRALPAGKKSDDAIPDEVIQAEVTVDETGAVTAVREAPPELARAFAITASAWRFAPARRGGVAVPAQVRVPFVVVTIDPRHTQLGRGGTPPRVISQVPPIYPFEMRVSGMRGEVMVDFMVDIEGRVRNAYVVRSLNPSFDDPAIEAVRRWRFEAARVGERPVATRMQVPIIFSLNETYDGGRGPLTAPRKADMAKLPEAYRYDTPPKPTGTVRPVYPYALLKARKSGQASVGYIVDEKGRVVRADVREASAPEFGRAVQAAIESFTFQPALRAGKPGPAILGFKQEFNEDGQWQLVSEEDLALLRREEKRPETIRQARDLDGPPVPRSRGPPRFPQAVADTVTTGEALIEFIIDEEGWSRLPRIVSATDEAFGYAAVQAVAAWRFEPPLRGGKPVAVRVQVPMVFGSAAEKK